MQVGLFVWPFVPTGSVFGFVPQGAAVLLSDVLEFLPVLAVGYWAARGIRSRVPEGMDVCPALVHLGRALPIQLP